MSTAIPTTQHAVQLVGPDQLQFNQAKPTYEPGPHQVLGQVEAVGLCFSDLKLLKQFGGHARKTPILSGIDGRVLDEIPSYQPADRPTVPGHECVVRIVAVGPGVTRHQVGRRFLVQTDYRWLPTANSNASFGYNFEGGLQEYVLMDERVITAPDGESMLIPVSEQLSASAVALVEPWACVEDAYVAPNRQRLTEGGHLLVVTDGPLDVNVLNNLFLSHGRPDQVTVVGADLGGLSVPVTTVDGIERLDDGTFDDVIYFGADADTAAALFPKVAAHGLYNIVQSGGRFGRPVVSQVGRVHYGGIRLVGTVGSDPAEAMSYIPPDGEIRGGDVINVIGAGGPMGVMHVIRNLCQGVPGVTVLAGDVSPERLATLDRLARPLAEKNGVTYRSYDPKATAATEPIDYAAIMAPIPTLVAQAVLDAAPKGVINIFAGIPATVNAEIDLDAYISKQLFFIGTSGSVLEDMKAVLAKVEAGTLDTNLSVAAVASLDGAVAGIRAVENHEIPGKIIVYPSCKGLGLQTLEQLESSRPEVAQRLRDGLWNEQAEAALLQATHA